MNPFRHFLGSIVFGKTARSLVAAALLSAGTLVSQAEEPVVAIQKVESNSLDHKVLCGYQAWFRCPGDPAGEGWRHWGRAAKLTPESVTFEMWPDVSELGEEEKYPAPGFTLPSGKPAFLYSSAHPRTIARHFRWLRDYDLDGVFLQRFLVNLRNESYDSILAEVRKSAAETGRVYAICYDLTGARSDQIYDQLTKDWQRLVTERKITRDDRYLHHNGRPVVFLWGFFSDRFSAETAHRILDHFQTDPQTRVTLIGGCPWYWRREPDPEWARAFRRFDILSPWNVGNFTEVEGKRHAATASWKDDLEDTKRAGIGFLPVVYPGFGWTNLQGPSGAKATAPRLGGDFLWRQFHTAAELDLKMAYVAMFDEVDEATAIFKVTNEPPVQARFTTYEGLPSDWYLRLTREGTRLLRGARPNQRAIPLMP